MGLSVDCFRSGLLLTVIGRHAITILILHRGDSASVEAGRRPVHDFKYLTVAQINKVVWLRD